MKTSFLKLKISLVIFFLIIIFPSFLLALDSPKSVLVKFEFSQEIDQLEKKFGVDSDQIDEIKPLNIYRIKNPSFWQRTKINVQKVFSRNITYSEEDSIFHPSITTNDTYYHDQWQFDKISAPSAWDLTTGSSQIKIAIIDTGINGLHQDLNGKILSGKAFIDSGDQYDILANTDSDDYNHGTGVASVASAQTNNNLGMAGLDWQAQLLPIKVFNALGQAYGSDVALGIIYAADQGAKIINLSIGGKSSSTAIQEAINYAFSRGCLIVASAGNDNGAIEYPAKYENAIAVGSTDKNDLKSSFSNYGSELDVVAPGEDILVAVDNDSHNEYSFADGTSVSVPLVSGLAGLIWARYPNLTNLEIRSLIEGNADKVSAMSANFDEKYGYGRINAYKSLNPTVDVSSNSYHYTLVSQNAYPTLVQGQTGYNFTISFKNTGTATWYKNIVNLATDREKDRTPRFIREGDGPSGWISPNRVQMQESSVSPGQIALFSFWMKAKNDESPGNYQEYFRLVADGISWMEDYGIYWDITVQTLADSYHYQWTGQNAYPTISAGQAYNFVVSVKNTGLATWQKGQVNLATDREKDRTPRFIREGDGPSGWSAPNRIIMQENSVVLGQTATYSFWMKAKNDESPGNYQEYFRLVADGISWMEDYGIYWEVSIQ